MTNTNIKELPYLIYDGLPISVKKFIRPLIRFFSLQSIISFISQLRPSVFLVHGKEKWGGECLNILFIGDKNGIPFLTDFIYSGEPEKESLGKVFIWRIKSRMNSALHRIDLVFVNTEGFFSRFLPRKFIIIPVWILFMLDLSKKFPESWNLSKSKNKSLRENLREFRRQNYSYEITNDLDKFEYFYHHMYSPYITKRFEELTFLTDFNGMKKVLRKGWLLLVKKGDNYVSGMLLVRISDDTIFAHSLGIAEGSMEYFKTGALTGVYYFSILWAKEMGYKWLNFGHCRSFFKDGVFNYKKHWSMEIKISERFKNIFGIKIYNYSKGVRNFLEKNPFVFIDQGKLKGFIFFNKDRPHSLEEIQSCVKTYSVPGLDYLVIVSDQGFDKEAKDFANSCITPKIQLSDSSVFIC